MKQELIDFITSRTHLKAHEINPELKLAEDIGFYGLDAISFFEEFFDEFEIKNFNDFDIDMHIDGGPDIVPKPMNWIKNLINNERRKYLKPDVTMEHLEKVIEIGKWINEK